MPSPQPQEAAPLIAEAYIDALEVRYGSVCFDHTTGKSYPFRDVFYPVSIGEGSAAFQSYAEQMRQAESAFERSAADPYVDVASLIGLIDGNDGPEEQACGSGWDEGPLMGSSPEIESEGEALLQDIDFMLDGLEQAGDSIPEAASAGGAAGMDDAAASLDGAAAPDVQEAADSILGLLDEEEGHKGAPAAFKGGSPSANEKQGQGVLAERPQAYAGSVPDTPGKDVPAVDLLMSEPEAKDDPSVAGRLVVGSRSRVLLMGSAGHGKTTMLRMIALHYCRILSGRGTSTDRQMAYRYGLPREIAPSAETPLPCLLELRDIPGRAASIEELMADSVAKTLHTACPGASFSAEGIASFVSSIEDRTVLLIDGLDELAEERRVPFLEMLEEHLASHKHVPVLLSSRAASVLSGGVRRELRRMQFRGRTVLPLSERQSREYAEQWVSITQQDDGKGRARLQHMLDQVFLEGKCSYLRDFMRTPLELVAVLKQLSNGALSLSRHQLFHDMLYDLFTSHEAYSRKSAVFEDKLSILGLIAYWMQAHRTLVVREDDIGSMLPDFGRLSLYGDETDLRTAEGIIQYLEEIASNVGVIEKDGRTERPAFTFPIRAYQEYLAAYACCHLCLEDGFRPDPEGMAERHLADPYWNNAMRFLLMELDEIGHSAYPSLLGQIFRTADDAGYLKSLVEFDLNVDLASAIALSDRFFSCSVLPEKESELLTTCAFSKSFPVFESALGRRYRSSASGGDAYLWAVSFLAVYRCLTEGQPPFSAARNALLSGDDASARQGACMMDIILGFSLDNKSYGFSSEQLDSATDDIRIDKDILKELYTRALRDKAPIFVQALSGLWLSGARHSEFAGRLLDENMRGLMLDIISKSEPAARRAMLAGKDAYRNPDYAAMRRLMQTLGSMPFAILDKPRKKIGVYTSALFECLYERSRSDFAYDSVALSMAGLWLCWDEERFRQAWCFDVCEGLPSAHVRKDSFLPHERKLFELVRPAIEPLEDEYWRAMSSAVPDSSNSQDHPLKDPIAGPSSAPSSSIVDGLEAAARQSGNLQDPAGTVQGSESSQGISPSIGRRRDTRLNYIDPSHSSHGYAEISEADLFRAGNLQEAVAACLEHIKKAANSRTRATGQANLAFLLRYAGMHGDSLLPDGLASVPELLAPGVGMHDPYALANQGLYLLGIGEAGRAEDAFAELDVEGWQEIATGFWLPVMWQEKRDPEGALICVLAEQKGACSFDGYDEMMRCAQMHYPSMHL